MKKLGGLFILLSVLLFGYIGYEQLYSFYLEKKLFANTEELSQSLRSEVENEKSEKEIPQYKENTIADLKNVELSIPKIELETPVIEGTSSEKLRVAVGHLKGTGILGAKGQNFVVLGHRSHISGKFFNRLNELSNGDELLFRSPDQTLTFRVIDKKIIEPTQLEVLEPVEGKSVVTLITCHPMYSNKERLVVIGEKII
ncbi:class D sortase [Halobacillus yeomjeoni]|uniref:Class D sortase n=1 Tax=Halobacillus yeomjeoni TaxID=311194 RepID=A0A931HTZ4_9BACI|nr:class D sortase [Halobacillus yeomjeoni]MBH0229757.1 class D sortase [Halobacillus yeomjeoni]